MKLLPVVNANLITLVIVEKVGSPFALKIYWVVIVLVPVNGRICFLSDHHSNMMYEVI